MTPNETTESTPLTAAESTEQTASEHTETGHQHEGEHTHTHAHGPALNPELMREVSVEVPAKEVSKSFARVTKRYQKLARIPGFRAGKVPESLIRSRFAREVRQEVMEQLVQDRFRSEMEAKSLQPISQPQIVELNLVDDQPLRFRAQFEVAPEIDVTGYNTVTVEKPTVDLDEVEFKSNLDQMLEPHVTIESVQEDRPLQDGDWAEITFTGKRRFTTTPEGAETTPELEDVEGENILVEVGGANTLPAFTEALRGKNKGQEFNLEVDYPADFGDDRLQSQTVSYDVVVNDLKRKNFPEQNDELAKQLSDKETWQEFEADLREQILNRKKRAAEGEAKNKLVDALAEKFTFPVPESFVQQQIDLRLDRGLRSLAQQGMTQEQMRQLDFARIREAQREEAVKEVKASLILDKIAEAENVQVKEDDVERELFMLSIQSREPLEQLRERLKNDGTLNRIREQMRREATATALYDKLT